MFSFTYDVKMFDTDASGFLFFTSQMRMAHEAYEAYMAETGLGIARILRTSDYLLPIVHAETDYRGRSHVGDRLRIEVTATRVGTSSFALGYRFCNQEGEEVGTAATVHVAVDKRSHQKRPLPPELRAAVENLAP